LSTLRQPPFTVIIRLHSILPQTQFSMNVRNTLSSIVISSGIKFWKDSLSPCTSPLIFNELTSLRRHFPLLFCKLTYSSWELSTYILHLVGGYYGTSIFRLIKKKIRLVIQLSHHMHERTDNTRFIHSSFSVTCIFSL
jgi:hypothetical protein